MNGNSLKMNGRGQNHAFCTLSPANVAKDWVRWKLGNEASRTLSIISF
jgi:hypothetical protein